MTGLRPAESTPCGDARAEGAHPAEGKGRNKRKPNRLGQTPPQAPSQRWEENGTGPARALFRRTLMEAMTRRI